MKTQNKGIFFRVTDEEYHKIKLEAEKYSMSVGDYFKALVFGPPKTPKPKMGLKTQNER